MTEIIGRDRETIPTDIGVLGNGRFRFSGFEARDKAHIDGMKHLTTLIIPVLIGQEDTDAAAEGDADRIRILTVDKMKKDAMKGDVSFSGEKTDIFGGHITAEDLAEWEIREKSISPFTVYRSAYRELREELNGPGLGPQGWDIRLLYPAGLWECDSAKNRELSVCYLFPVYPGVYAASDDYTDERGCRQKIDLPVRVRTLGELRSMCLYGSDLSGKYGGRDCQIKDGLGRLLRDTSRRKELDDRILAFFSRPIRPHVCEENLGYRCRCGICGRICHSYSDNDDGSFAASGKVATTVCVNCGKSERYYSDTGTVIETSFEPEDIMNYK